MKKYLVVLIAILCVSTNSFAACDQQRKEYERFIKICDDYTNTSYLIMGIGGIFTYTTAGISLAAGGLLGSVPGFIAKNSCRIKEEKKFNLEVCEGKITNDQRILEARLKKQKKHEKKKEKKRKKKIKKLKKAKKEEKKRIDSIQKINAAFDVKRSEAEAEYHQAVAKVIQTLVDDGFDVRESEVQEIIARSRDDLRERLNERLEDLEEKRKEEIDRI